MTLVRITQNTEELIDILRAIQANDGYCPCKLLKNDDTKCMCKEFRDRIHADEIGPCTCGLYELVEVEKE